MSVPTVPTSARTLVATSVATRFRVFRLLAAAVFAAALLLSLRPPVEAANYRTHIARVPDTPSNTQTVRIWINSDTVSGETAGVETLINGVYTKHLGTFQNGGIGGYPGANWRVDLPAQPAGTFVQYQLFTRNQSGGDYGFDGFNYSYTVNGGDVQWNDLYHNTFDSWARFPSGAVAAGTEVTLRLHTAPGDADSVALRVYTYNPATDNTSGPVDYAMSYQQTNWYPTPVVGQWSYTLATPASPAILYYHFVITDAADVDYYGDDHSGPHDNLNQGGTGAASDNQGAEGFQLTVYANGFQTPDWLQDAVVYQIFPDRFRNGNTNNDYCRAGGTTGCPLFYGDQDALLREPWNTLIGDPRQPGPYQNQYGTQFYGGDLQGLIDKLDYLKAAGFDTIYTTPIFDGSSNHRYDTDNYMAIDPALGTQADFDALIAALNARGMHLIVDGVFNHTSSDSVYFDRYHRYSGNNGACESLGSTYRDWYNFYNNDAPCGTGDYEGWFGYDSLAVLQDGSAEVRDTIYRDANSVVDTWYDRGVAGWRFDVADEISHDWWRDFRPYAKADAPNGPLVGEVWPDASAFLLGDQLDSVMNYRFRKNVLGFVRQAGFADNDNNGNNEIIALSPSQFDRALRSVREDYPPQATAAMLNLLDSHDTNRLRYLVDIVGESDAQTLQRQKLAALFQYTYMGAPMVYYGDEVALDSPSLANGVNGPEDDPYNRAPYPWADEAGDANAYGPADADMLAYYTRLGELRRQYPFLSDGDFYTLVTGDTTTWTSDDDTTYVFARTGSSETVFVALNPGNNANTVIVSSGLIDYGSVWEDMLTGDIYNAPYGGFSVTLPPRTGVFLAKAVTSLTVAKTVNGDATGLNDWQFTVNGNGGYTTPAAGGEFTITGIITGTTTVAETTVGGWTPAVSCDNGATGTDAATFNLDTGEDVVCTFTNTQDAPPSGDLTITKTVVGTPPGADWAFTGDLGPFNLPASGGGATYSDQAVGDYTINETYVPGWATTTSCTPGSETGGRSVSLTLDDGEAAECVFTNTLCQPGFYDDMSACVPTDPGYYTDASGAVA
ncbi:MAG TPA: glycoside hydrolase family 13 protein, partial [Promineifilum sp.]|nr:glycoside hydrolase family 13 protein [Promineifilum sp.]